MKGLIVLLVAFLMLVFCNATASQAQPIDITLGFNPFSQEVLVGDPVDVGLVISGLGDGIAPSLSTFDLDITFDSTILSYSGASFGDIVLGDQLNFYTGFGTTYFDFDWGGGLVNLFGLSSDTVTALNTFQADSFTLATLTFDTLAFGTSPLNISTVWSLGDADGNPLTYSLEIGSSIKVVPEPATMLLLGSGLAGLGFLRKKNQVS